MKKLTGIFFTFVILACLPVVAHEAKTGPESLPTLDPRQARVTEAFAQRYNIHTVTAGQCYRSKLISEPDDLRTTLSALGIKTVLNVCGPCPDEPWWGREKTICIEQGVQHIDITLQAEAFSDPAQVAKLLEAFKTAPQPFLIHCMRGADRTGEGVALWLRHMQNAPAYVALDAINWRFNHNPFTHWEKRMFMRWLYQQDEVNEVKRSPSTLPSRDTFSNTHCVAPGQLHRSHYLYPHELASYIAEHGIKTVIVLEELLGRRGVHGRDYARICKHHTAALHEVALAPYAVDDCAAAQLQKLFLQAARPILVTCLTGAELCSEAVAWWHHTHNQLDEQIVHDLFSLRFHCVPGLAKNRQSFFREILKREVLLRD